jgi:predicted secreted Zn-dependent protease
MPPNERDQRSMKGITISLLLLMVTVTTYAGDDNTGAATIEKTSPDRITNSVAPPVVTETFEYYEVCGCCEKDLHHDLKQKCIRWKDGRKYDSVTNWKMKWDYGHARTPRACTTDSFTVIVEVVFQLPKWVRTGEAPPALEEKWDTYMKKLMVHEQGHRDRAVEAASELTRAVAELPPANTCDLLDREVHKLFHARMDKLVKEQEEYDELTNHGAAQGAVFP